MEDEQLLYYSGISSVLWLLTHVPASCAIVEDEQLLSYSHWCQLCCAVIVSASHTIVEDEQLLSSTVLAV